MFKVLNFHRRAAQRTQRGHEVHRGRRQAAFVAVVASATLVIAIPASGAGSPMHIRPASNEISSARPSAGHLIVGAPIKLPSALFDVGAQGSASLVSPSQARDVAIAMWHAWDSALYTNDTRALTQLAVAGPMLAGTINNCAFPGNCLSGATQRPTMGQLEVAVSKQRSYPLYFMSTTRTTSEVQESNGLSQEGPWMELQILTKASSSAPWQLSFDSGYSVPNGDHLPWLPFDFTKTLNDPSGSGGAYTAAPTISTSVATPNGSTTIKLSASNYLPLLAAYWQSYKVVGHAPENTVFFTGGESSGEGQYLAESREGSLYAGSRNYYKFAFDPGAGAWRFAVGGGYAMVCGSVLDTQTQTPVSGLLYQNSDENNYGAPLPPGSYSKITTSGEHEECVYPSLGGPNYSWGGLSVAGNDVYSAAVTGHRVASSPVPGQSDSAGVLDLETDYSVLSSELAQYSKQYNACEASNGKSCVKSLAKKLAEQFALFDNFITTYNFPAQFGDDVDALDKSTRKLTELFGAVSNGNETTGSISSIKQSEKDFVREFEKLVKGLSSV